MGGLDKYLRCDALVEHGWVEVEYNRLVPPDSLWKNKPESFHVYDALELQACLGDPDKMSEEMKEYCDIY